MRFCCTRRYIVPRYGNAVATVKCGYGPVRARDIHLRTGNFLADTAGWEKQCNARKLSARWANTSNYRATCCTFGRSRGAPRSSFDTEECPALERLNIVVLESQMSSSLRATTSKSGSVGHVSSVYQIVRTYTSRIDR